MVSTFKINNNNVQHLFFIVFNTVTFVYFISFKTLHASPRWANVNKKLMHFTTIKNKGVTRTSVQAINYVTPMRADIMAKYVYAIFLKDNIESEWGKELYNKHIYAINKFEEHYPEKNNLDGFIKAFHNIIQSIREKGFNQYISTIPVDKQGNICNGAHRLAACLAYNKKPTVTTYGFPVMAPNLSLFELQKRKLTEEYTDYMALQYCQLKPNCCMVLLFPRASEGKYGESYLDNVKTFLCKCSDIVYEKDVYLTNNGATNLLRSVYAGDHWIGDWDNDFAGIQHKVYNCFPKDFFGKVPLRVILIDLHKPAELAMYKQKIREFIGVDNHSMHTTDTHDQAIELAKLLFNDNSIHFLQHARRVELKNFEQYFALYSTWLKENKVKVENFCIDGSAVMSAYGLRDCADLDYLHHGYNNLHYESQDIASHNSSINHHTTTKDEIIFNPKNYFYYGGLKFTSLDVTKEMKKKRGEPKDIIDVELIEALQEKKENT